MLILNGGTSVFEDDSQTEDDANVEGEEESDGGLESGSN